MTNKTNNASPGGGDNKIHQIIMAVITTIAAPVIVFFVTNNLKNNTAPAPTPIVQVVTATAPAAEPQANATQPGMQPTAVAGTEVVKPTSTALAPSSTPTAAAATASATAAASATSSTVTPTLLPTATNTTAAQQPTPTVRALPGGVLPAGTPVLVNGLELTISTQDLKLDGKTIGVLVHIKNTTAEKQILSFAPASISIKDNTGHSYAPLFGDKKSGCKKEALNAARKVEIEAKGEVTLASVSPDKAGGWCVENPGVAVPRFTGPLSKNAKTVLVQINGLGPFEKLQIEIGL